VVKEVYTKPLTDPKGIFNMPLQSGNQFSSLAKGESEGNGKWYYFTP